jgi:hypothetical protein
VVFVFQNDASLTPYKPTFEGKPVALAVVPALSGDREPAAKQLRYLLETPPGLKDTEWEQPFSDLLRKCESP